MLTATQQHAVDQFAKSISALGDDALIDTYHQAWEDHAEASAEGSDNLSKRIVMEGTDPFATTNPDARLVKLLLRARRFNAVLTQGEGIAFAALAQREGVSPSYFLARGRRRRRAGGG